MAKKIRIVCIGKVKEPFILEGIKEYQKRLSPHCSVDIIELKDEGMQKEKEKLQHYLDEHTYLLDEQGTVYTSLSFAKLIKDVQELTFIIGGHEGTDVALKKQAKTIALSSMTFTHEMCRLFLFEQIYRAHMILNNKPYHK